MTKQELQNENDELKIKVEELERRVARLKARISDLLRAGSIFGRGLPWRP
jgi:uncharacterized protein YceH (UPF0502 family)